MNDLEAAVRAAFPTDLTKDAGGCFFCDGETDRVTVINSSVGAFKIRECLPCRRDRVQRQVDAGRRPASDLDEDRLPENRRD